MYPTNTINTAPPINMFSIFYTLPWAIFMSIVKILDKRSFGQEGNLCEHDLQRVIVSRKHSFFAEDECFLIHNYIKRESSASLQKKTGCKNNRTFLIVPAMSPTDNRRLQEGRIRNLFRDWSDKNWYSEAVSLIAKRAINISINYKSFLEIRSMKDIKWGVLSKIKSSKTDIYAYIPLTLLVRGILSSKLSPLQTSKEGVGYKSKALFIGDIVDQGRIKLLGYKFSGYIVRQYKSASWPTMHPISSAFSVFKSNKKYSFHGTTNISIDGVLKRVLFRLASVTGISSYFSVLTYNFFVK